MHRSILLALAMLVGCSSGDDGDHGDAGDGDDTPGMASEGGDAGTDTGDGTDTDASPVRTSGDPDCRGVSGGSAREDRCGTCDDDPDNDCVQDCAGTWGGNAVEDMCGICDRDPDNDCVQDCAGTWGGNAMEDMCGACDRDRANDCVQDCEGTWGGTASEDMCGTCDAVPGNDCVQDCEGTWGGPASEDMCGICDAVPGNDCVQDCDGTWGGAVVRDCAGVCGGSAGLDLCGNCDGDSGNDCDCLGVEGGGATRDACGTCDADPSNDCELGFVLDIATHLASPETNPLGAAALAQFVGQYNTENYPWIERTEGTAGSAQYDRVEYGAQVLSGSDTTVGVLNGFPYSVGPDGMDAGGFAALTNEDLLDAAGSLSQLHPDRVLTACAVMPNDRLDVQLEMMELRASDCHLWYATPPWSPVANGGYFLDDEAGSQMIQQGLDLGRPIFLVWKGLPMSGFSPTYTDPRDVGPAARLFPSATFVILHSAFEHGFAAGDNSEPEGAFSGDACDGTQREGGQWPEGPYDELDPAVMAAYPLDRGVNSLIKSLRDANIGPNGRDLDDADGPVTTQVYASLNHVWAELMTSRNDEAVHVLGKLLLHVGEDRILWGTNSLWFGGPQPQIDAFGCFEISQEFQDTYGYPALTEEIKAKILGLNAAAMLSQLSDVDLP
ncbi:MAG: amidohydrolase family protein [Myxococcales bacterium]|nr:amidohydrolase family protein [Myxococcales bacterium]